MHKVDRAADNPQGVYRDSAGKRLADYPRPSVAVDTAVLTLVPDGPAPGALSVLQVRRTAERGWGLPGTFLREGEQLADAVRRALRDKAGVSGREPRQLRVFDNPHRDDRGWVLSVAHIDVVRHEELTPVLSERDDTRLMPVHAPGELTYDHLEIIARAVDHLRTRYATAPDPDLLLPREFTLRQLRLVHEAVAGDVIQRDNFRRAMELHLKPTGRLEIGARGRPAELFRRR